MAPGSIDDRHPASVEGALWPLFFRKYEPTLMEKDFLVLHQRDAVLENMEVKSEPVHVLLGDEISLPETKAPVMVSIVMKPTVIGKLLDIFYRPPLSKMVVTYEDGTAEAYRIIPAMMKEGLLVSPLVKTPEQYLLVSTGHSDISELKHARSITVSGGFGAKLAYQFEIEVSFTVLDNEVMASGYKGNMVDSYVQLQKNLDLLLANNPLNDPIVTRVPEGLLAHAPSQLRLPVHEAGELVIGFGLRDGAWQDENRTSGVCFSVNTAAKTIMERCLKPLENEADRGQQSAIIALPAGTEEVFLRTSCIQGCAWGWSYWSKATINP